MSLKNHIYMYSKSQIEKWPDKVYFKIYSAQLVYVCTSKLKILWIKNGDAYRDGNKGPETRFNKVYTHSSRAEQVP